MCKEVREQDEIICVECGRRWDTTNERPACIDDQSKAEELYHEKLKQATTTSDYRKAKQGY